mmetsp:Transcript_5276/g.14932  ORF Transcript_5276/g.14932 Transcript_5276/m.14932 type:complete len:241 (+) Transcript_5276:380-1102(+)
MTSTVWGYASPPPPRPCFSSSAASVAFVELSDSTRVLLAAYATALAPSHSFFLDPVPVVTANKLPRRFPSASFLSSSSSEFSVSSMNRRALSSLFLTATDFATCASICHVAMSVPAFILFWIPSMKLGKPPHCITGMRARCPRVGSAGVPPRPPRWPPTPMGTLEAVEGPRARGSCGAKPGMKSAAANSSALSAPTCSRPCRRAAARSAMTPRSSGARCCRTDATMARQAGRRCEKRSVF